MKTSSRGLAMIARFEGEVLHTYKDIAGIATIGVGHVLRPGEAYTSGITHDQAMSILAGDVGLAEVSVSKLVKVTLTQDQFDALVSLTFNIGAGAFARSTLLVLLNKGDYQGAADQFPRWSRAVVSGVLTTNPGLLARRNAERACFLAPDLPAVS